jgi:hypothetical protein
MRVHRNRGSGNEERAMAQGSGEQILELVTQMRSTIEQHFLPTMEELHNKLQSETQRVTNWLQDVQHSAEQARPVLHDNYQKAQQRIDEMEAMVKQEVAESAQAFNAYVGHLHDAKGQAHELLNTALSHVHDATDKLHQADDVHASIGDTVTHALGDLQGQVAEHLTTIEGHHHAIVDALHALDSHANAHATDLGAKLQQTGEFVSEHVASVVQLHVGNANELLAQQKDHFVSTIGEALGGHVGDVVGHVQGFVQTGESLGQAFDGGLGDVLQKVDEVGKLIDEIKPVIDLAKALS